eukprot:5376044-Prymnesium_polylepis.1
MERTQGCRGRRRCSHARSARARAAGSCARRWQEAAAACATAGAGVAGDVLHVKVEMKAKLELERLRVTRIAE